LKVNGCHISASPIGARFQRYRNTSHTPSTCHHNAGVIAVFSDRGEGAVLVLDEG